MEKWTEVRTEATEKGDRGLVLAMGERNDALTWAVGTRKGNLVPATGRGKETTPGSPKRVPDPQDQGGLAWAMEETGQDPEVDSGAPA